MQEMAFDNVFVQNLIHADTTQCLRQRNLFYFSSLLQIFILIFYFLSSTVKIPMKNTMRFGMFYVLSDSVCPLPIAVQIQWLYIVSVVHFVSTSTGNSHLNSMRFIWSKVTREEKNKRKGKQDPLTITGPIRSL